MIDYLVNVMFPGKLSAVVQHTQSIQEAGSPTSLRGFGPSWVDATCAAVLWRDSRKWRVPLLRLLELVINSDDTIN